MQLRTTVVLCTGLLFGSASLLSGCSGMQQTGVDAPPPLASKRVLQGSVHGGQQPVSGAAIQLWQVGTGANDQPPTALLNHDVYTDGGGGFNISNDFTCTPNTTTYLTATGGNPGLVGKASNSAIAEMVMLDVCYENTPARFINVNEITTVASVFSAGQWMNHYPNMGYSLQNSSGGYQSQLTFEAIVDIATGTSPGYRLTAGQTYPFGGLYALANVMASCVNSAGGVAGDGSACGKLFTLTTPPGGTAPTNTVDALLNIYRNPTQNVSQIFALAPPAAPFQPAATSPPANWYMRLYNGVAPTPRYYLCTGWGDSLTAGGEDGSGVTVSLVLPTLPSCYLGNNDGVGGQTSTQIAVRQGGLPSTATVEGGMIPASGPVVVDIPFAMSPETAQGPGSVLTTISGVPGAISYDYTNNVIDFTRTTPGAAVASAANAPFVANVGNQDDGFVVIWAGRNNTSQPGQIQSDIAAMVASLPSTAHYVVLSITNTNTPSEYQGQGAYNQLIAINQKLAATYPNNYLDVRSALIAAYTPSDPEDVIDHGHDVPPSTFRALDQHGTIAGALDAASCNFAVATGNAPANYTLTIEQEKILIQAGDGVNVTGCIRGYAGTQAVAHAAGTAFTGVDYVHLSAAGYTLVAQQVDAYIQAH